jgi:hypothetical protein
MNQPAWASMASAPRDGSLVLVRIRASEQGPAEVDAVRFARSARSGEEGWVANDSDPFARVVYAEKELSSWMPLPTQLPKLRSTRDAPPAPADDAVEEGDGSAI